MIIKDLDNLDKDISILQNLMLHPKASIQTKKNIEQQIKNIKSGVKNQKDAAYEINFYHNKDNYAVIHDLRLEHNGRVAQIDHLIIDRLMDIRVCESKNFSDGFAINKLGEFTRFFNRKPQGMPSPIEQNKKHIMVLEDVIKSGKVELPKRLGINIRPTYKNLILVSNNSLITKPEGFDNVIKIEQLVSLKDKEIENAGFKDIMALSKAIYAQTLHDFARSLAQQHVPIQFNWAAKFGLENLPTLNTINTIEQKDNVTHSLKTLSINPTHQEFKNLQPKTQEPKKTHYECQGCSNPIDSKVLYYCRINKVKFDNKILCRNCQP